MMITLSKAMKERMAAIYWKARVYFTSFSNKMIVGQSRADKKREEVKKFEKMLMMINIVPCAFNIQCFVYIDIAVFQHFTPSTHLFI